MPIVAIHQINYSIVAQFQYTTPTRKLQEIYQIFGKPAPSARNARAAEKIFSKKLAYTPERAKILWYHYIVKRRVNAQSARLSKITLPAATRAAAARAAAARGAAGSVKSGKFFISATFLRKFTARHKIAARSKPTLLRQRRQKESYEISNRKLTGRNPSLHEIIAECASFIQPS